MMMKMVLTSKNIRGIVHMCAYLRIKCIALHADYAKNALKFFKNAQKCAFIL